MTKKLFFFFGKCMCFLRQCVKKKRIPNCYRFSFTCSFDPISFFFKFPARKKTMSNDLLMTLLSNSFNRPRLSQNYLFISKLAIRLKDQSKKYKILFFSNVDHSLRHYIIHRSVSQTKILVKIPIK